MMEKEENKQEEQNRRKELLHAYSKLTMDNEDEQMEQDKMETYLRTSTEEELKSSMEEEYNEDQPFEEQDDEKEWTTQSSHLTNKEKNALFIAFINGDVEDQRNIWINAKTNLARTLANEETNEREEEILERIIPTDLVDVDETFNEQMIFLNIGLTIKPWIKKKILYQKTTKSIPSLFLDKRSQLNSSTKTGKKRTSMIQPSKPLITSYRDYRRQDKETVHPLLSELDDQLIGAKYFTEQDVIWGYNNECIKDGDKWEITKINQRLFKPIIMFSNPCSIPMTSQTKIDEIFQDQKNKQQITVNKGAFGYRMWHSDVHSHTIFGSSDYTHMIKEIVTICDDAPLIVDHPRLPLRFAFLASCLSSFLPLALISDGQSQGLFISANP